MFDRRSRQGTALVAMVFVCCGCANPFADDPDPRVWPAYQDGYAAGGQHQGSRRAADDCYRLGADTYANTASPEAVAFTAGCTDAANHVVMQSEQAVESGYSDVPHGD